MKIAEIIQLQSTLVYQSIKDLTVDDIKNILGLKKQIDKTIKEHNELLVEVMKKYEIEAINDSFNWVGHKEFSNINRDVNILNELEYLISPLNFLNVSQIKLVQIDSILVLENLIDNLAKL